jgi:thioredoxin reductase (NADPH)
MVFDVVIIGSGAAGLSAGLYAGRYLLKVLVIGKEFGGETSNAGIIWNYPGAKDVDGYELMKIMREQGKAVGVEYLDGAVTSIENQDGCFKIFAGEKRFEANAVIFAMGTVRRRLGLTHEKELTSKGVHFCATCDGALYMGKTVAVVGGGDAAIKAVALLGTYASKIFVLVRGSTLSAEPKNVEEVKALGDKVEILFDTRVEGLVGESKLEKVMIRKGAALPEELVLDGLFVEIGTTPNVVLAQSVGVILDDKGYIAVDNKMATNVPGLFAAGDTTSHFGSFKQDITAAAMGAVAATSAYNYRKVRGNVCELHSRPLEAGSLS